MARSPSARSSMRAQSGTPHSKSHERRVPGEIPELDRLIHERIRLGIISALAVNDSLSFSDLKRLLRTTDGNLSVHARKLEEGGYITLPQVLRRTDSADGISPDRCREASASRNICAAWKKSFARRARHRNSADFRTLVNHRAKSQNCPAKT